MNWITTTGNGTITSAGNRAAGPDSMNGNAVMYEPGKIFTTGGAPNYKRYAVATASAHVIDISAGPGQAPVVRRVGDSLGRRSYGNSVVLPDGQVFVVGGQTMAETFTDTTPVMTPELWNPVTGRFSPMAKQAVIRTYHSVAALLPDGRVFSGGGGLCGGCATNHPDGQIFTPPYLLNADGSAKVRPTVTAAPVNAAPGSTIQVTTGAAVKSFALIRMGTATHTVNTDQRRIPLPAGTGTTHSLTIPGTGTAIPGNYLLFGIDPAVTPSIGKVINIR